MLDFFGRDARVTQLSREVNRVSLLVLWTERHTGVAQV